MFLHKILHKIHLFTQKVDNTTMEKLSEASDLLVRAALLASGIASTTGENGGKGVSPKKADSKAKSDSYSPSELAKDKKKLMDLIDRAQDGDESALPVLTAGCIDTGLPAGRRNFGQSDKTLIETAN